MLGFVFGFIIVSIPLFLSLFFQDRLRGFLTVLSGLIVFHLILSLLTQALHIFSYSFVCSVHSLLAFLVLVAIIYKRERIGKLQFKFNWFVILAILVVGFQLWSVHYFFSGTISSINSYQEVVGNSYSYPYYSDEWIGVSLINHSIEDRSLPFSNPLWPNAHFVNPTFPFFSFFAELFLIFQVNPLTAYPLLAILSGLSICFLVYLILRKYDINLTASLLIALSIPYIINGANLPGLWYFIPLIWGLIMLLLGLLALVSGRKNLALLYLVLSVVFYPPIIVFSLPIMVVGGLGDGDKKINKNMWFVCGLLLFVFLTATIIIFHSTNLSFLWSAVSSLIFRTNLQNGIPRFDILTIIPIWLLVFSIFGVWKQIRERKYLLVFPVVIGFIFWVVYSGTKKVFIIEYQRVIIVTSILISLLSGLGVQGLIDFLHENYKLKDKFIGKILPAVVLMIFAVCSLFYTRYTDWQKLVMQIDWGEGQIEIAPSSPANKYLTREDLTLFHGIEKQKFIAPPWKGLVIGVSTKNYPVESKASTISNQFFAYKSFVLADCQEKYEISKNIGISYAYSSQFTCPHFVEIGKSSEGLVLYKFKD